MTVHPAPTLAARVRSVEILAATQVDAPSLARG